MSNVVEVKVPDIGDFKDVPVIEVLVKVGDTVDGRGFADHPGIGQGDHGRALAGIRRGQGAEGQVGDKIAEGTLVALIESAGAAAKVGAGDTAPAAPAAPPPPAAVAPAPSLAAPAAASFSGKVDLECEMLVLGAGPGGYSAAFRAADLGMKTVIVERYATLGGVCLNVGCIPSKALLHVAAVIEEAAHADDLGVSFVAPKVDIDKLRAHKEKVVGKLTGGLAGMAKARKVETVRGYGHFLDANHLEVEAMTGSAQEKTGEKKVIRFAKCIIAAGSAAFHLPFIPKDPRIVDSTGALELRFVPKRMLVIGGGIIGLEMATVYSTLGSKVDVVEMLDGLMQGPDRDLVKVWEKQNAKRFDKVMLKTKTVAVDAKPDGLWVTFEGEQAPAEAQCYDMILQSAGRTPERQEDRRRKGRRGGR